MTVIAEERVVVDREHPWPGLASFDEVSAEFFRGRDDDRKELFELISRSLVTVVYGLAGLGKTSLLQAGIFPLLRAGNWLPVPVRLEFGNVSLLDGVFDAIERETVAHGVTMPPQRSNETLWEFFHRRSTVFWNERHRIVKPVLVFDQFEELFTIGKDQAVGRTDFLQQLAGLAAGRPSPEALDYLAQNPAVADEIDPASHRYAVVISLREDYLGDLDALRAIYPAFDAVRKRVTRMNGESALQVVGAGKHLVDPPTALAIVNYVATGDMETTQPLAEMEVDPALLSVVCAELNKKRLAPDPPLAKIDEGLLKTNRESILADFYRSAIAQFEDQPHVRFFIEEGLLTPNGYRASMSEDQAQQQFEIDAATISELVKQRLVRIESRGRARRVELTHDLLTKVIAESRDRRRRDEEREEAAMRDESEREEKREQLRRKRIRLVRNGAIVAAVGLLVIVSLLYVRLRDAARTRAQWTVRAAVDHMEDGRPAQALAYLASAMRMHPGNASARRLAMSLIFDYLWYAPRAHWMFDAQVRSIRFAEDGKSLLVASGKSVHVVPVGTTSKSMRRLEYATDVIFAAESRGRVIAAAGRHVRVSNPDGRATGWDEPSDVSSISISSDGSLLTVVMEQQIHVRDMGGRLRLAIPLESSTSVRARFTLDGGSLVVLVPRSGLNVGIHNLRNVADSKHLTIGDAKSPEYFSSYDVDPNTMRVATADRAHLVLWSLNTQTPTKLATIKTGSMDDLVFSVDGRSLLGISEQKVHLWSVDALQKMIGENSPATIFGESIASAFFTGDDRHVITTAVNGQIQVWSLGESMAAPIDRGRELGPVAVSRDGRHLAVAARRSVRVLTTPGLLRVAIPGLGLLSGDGENVLGAIAESHFEVLGSVNGLRRSKREMPPIDSFAMSPTESRILYSVEGSGWTLQDLETDHSIALDAPSRPSDSFSEAQFSGDGNRIFLDFREVYDARTGARVRSFDEFHAGASSWTVSYDGSKVAVVTATEKLAVLHVDTGRVSWIDGDYQDARFDRSGKLLIAVDGDAVRIISTDTRKPVGEPILHNASVTFAAFSHDPAANVIVTASKDRVAQVWRRSGPNAAWEPIGSPTHLRKPIDWAEFSPDGTMLLTAAQGDGWFTNDVRLWESETGFPLTKVYQVVLLRPTFGQYGRRLIMNTPAQVFELRNPSPAEANLLAELAESIAGLSLDANGVVNPITEPRTIGIPKKLAATDTAKLIACFQATNTNRPLTPFTTTKLNDFIRERLANPLEGDRAETADYLASVYPGAVP